MTVAKERAPRNRTIVVNPGEKEVFQSRITRSADLAAGANTTNRFICADAFEALKLLPRTSFDLLFADPPYNLTKAFGEKSFRRTSMEEYEVWLESWVTLCTPLLKATASVYICGDWRSASAIQRVGMKYFHLQNRITWEREKGRGAKRNWKNAAEDIWFFTMSDEFTFNLDAVKIRRRVLAPYTENGTPKDWRRTNSGDFRETHPSNMWTNISVPFWSMPENTDHPTQKPEKLLAKIILASTDPGELILDPFAGSGTTAVVAKKLNRQFVAIESDLEYCALAVKRLEMAEKDPTIQGFAEGVFWERNSGPGRK